MVNRVSAVATASYKHSQKPISADPIIGEFKLKEEADRKASMFAM